MPPAGLIDREPPTRAEKHLSTIGNGLVDDGCDLCRVIVEDFAEDQHGPL